MQPQGGPVLNFLCRVWPVDRRPREGRDVPRGGVVRGASVILARLREGYLAQAVDEWNMVMRQYRQEHRGKLPEDMAMVFIRKLPVTKAR